MADQTTPVATAKAVKYTFKGGAKMMQHPFLGAITIEHLNGPKGETFIKAIKKLDEQKAKTKEGYRPWMDQFVETSK